MNPPHLPISTSSLPISVLLATALVVTMKVFLLAPSASAQEAMQETSPNWHGFVEDKHCASCHSDIANTFKTHGMARSFAHSSRAERIENLKPPHGGGAASFTSKDTSYRMTETTEGLLFSKWQTAADGKPIHSWDTQVDWVMGSGASSRVYLVQALDGTLYQLPLAWYSQEQSWAKPPGTGKRDQEGGLRMIRRECMFCHTAVPTESTFDDHRFAEHWFPQELPEGIGCQRCHGPGANHLATARKAKQNKPKDIAERRQTRADVRATIVNPARLPPERRRDVCAQCHHQPAVAVFGQRRFDQTDYQFTAGQDLADFVLKLEVLDHATNGEPRPPSDRFEINHHAYRLEQSPCFTKTPPGALECTSCHDPHRKPERAVTLERTTDVCLGCHGTDKAPPRPTRAGANSEEPPTTAASLPQEHSTRTDCVSCHMPRRRTEDVVHVVMTDHRIQQYPLPEETRLAPRPERLPNVDDVIPLDSSSAAATPFDDAIRATTGLRLGVLESTGALERIVRELEATSPTANLTEAKVRLAQAHLRQGRLDLARNDLRELLAQKAVTNDIAVQAREWLAIVATRQNRREDAERLLGEAIALSTSKPAHLYFNRALIRRAAGNHTGSCQDLETAVKRNEFLARGWFHLGLCRKADNPNEAAEAFQHALRLDPHYSKAVQPLLDVLRKLDRHEKALRVEKHHQRP